MTTHTIKHTLYRILLLIILDKPNITIPHLLDNAMTEACKLESLNYSHEVLMQLLILAIQDMYETERNWIICNIDGVFINNEDEFNSIIQNTNNGARLIITQNGCKFLRSGLDAKKIRRPRGIISDDINEINVFEYDHMEQLIGVATVQRRARNTVDERRLIAKAINSRRGQAKFRQDLIDAYGQCLITGCKYEPILEAAHIHPYAEGGMFTIENGLLLRTDIHTLFDLGLIAICTINDNYRIIISEYLEDTEYEEYKDKSLLIPDTSPYKPDKDALNEHIYRASLDYLC